MAQTNYTPIILYNSGTTGNIPSTSNLASGELAINYTDGKLFYKDNNSTLQIIGWKTTPTTAGGTGLTSYTAGDLPYYASGSALSKLGIGTSGYVLESNGSAPTWVAQSTLSVGSATNATNTAITDNTSSSATWYPTIVSATTGNLPQTTSSTKLSFVPNTGVLSITGANLSGLTASSAVATDSSKNLISVTNTGTGNNVLSASPTFTGLISGNQAKFLENQSVLNTVQNAFTNSNADNANLIELQCGQYQKTTMFMVNSGCGAGNQANHITFQYGSTPTNAGYITSVGATTSYSSASDYRLKTNVIPIANALVKNAQLKPCTFNWIENNAEGQGFIAHELQEVFPDAVIGKKDELYDDGKIKPQAVDTSFLVAHLVACVQELATQVTALQAKVGT